jgi:hypothetical protein
MRFDDISPPPKNPGHFSNAIEKEPVSWSVDRNDVAMGSEDF